MTKGYVLLILIVIGTVAVAIAMKEPLRRNDFGQPHSEFLKFSHTFHIKEAGVACSDCHLAAATSKVSSDNLIGDHESCKSCHEEQLTNNCTYCHMNQGNIAPINNPEREIIFSHEQHTGKGEIKCETCHSGLEQVAYATKENMPAMATCIQCHTKKMVSNDCATCHTDFAGLIPNDHLVGEFRKDHKQLTRLGALDVSCSTCHAEHFCQDCHTGDELHGFGSTKDLMTDPSPKSGMRDAPRQLRLQAVHDLNFRFTHGINARSKQTDCASCHDQQTFCAACHNAGGNITQEKFKPVTHNQPGFTTIGKWSGGGLHADLARRDLETCISCHDVQGSDPTCMLCHVDGLKVN